MSGIELEVQYWGHDSSDLTMLGRGLEMLPVPSVVLPTDTFPCLRLDLF